MSTNILLDSLSYSNVVQNDPFLDKIFEFLRSRRSKVYLVGGYLRDLLLNRVRFSGESVDEEETSTLGGRDIDFVVKDGSVVHAKELALVLSGSSFVLDRERGTARVVTEQQGILRTIDFSPLGESIEKNLASRDFTINAFAVDVGRFFSKGSIQIPRELIDVTSGWTHLSKGKICAISEDTFLNDPLRLLRAVRLAGELSFEVNKDTQKLIKKQASLLTKVAGERILNELLTMFSLSSHKLIELCDILGLCDVLFPEFATLKGVKQNGYHHLDVWEHTIFTLEKLEEIVSSIGTWFLGCDKEIRDYLTQPLQKPYTKLSALKFAALLHDVGKPKVRAVDEDGNVHFFKHCKVGLESVEDICYRFKVGNKMLTSIITLVKEHMRPGFLAKEKELTKRAIYRFFCDCGGETPGVLILSLADRQAALGPLSTKDQLEEQIESVRYLMKLYLKREQNVLRSPKLISGGEIMKTFSIGPGPLIGELLELVEQKRFEGKVNSKRDALELVGKCLENREI